MTNSNANQGSALSKAQLTAHLVKAQNPGAGLIGTEFEAVILRPGPERPRVADFKDSVAPALDALCENFGWTPGPNRGVNGETVELRRNGASITLEPGGQIELSGAPQKNVHDTCQEFRQHRKELEQIGQSLGLSFLATGFHPFATREQMQWMPKGRYEVMRNYLPTQGKRALDMMLRTCTVQVNLDYPSERECGRRFCAMIKASSLFTALFANSPYKEGQASGYVSERSSVWSHVDPNRCGLPDFAFQKDFSYEKYVDWVLAVPMFFIYRDGQYLPCHMPFAQYLEQGFRGPDNTLHRATQADWELHLSTVFPEVRLKPFIEVRGADAVSHRYLCALPALCKGLLYHDDGLLALEELVADLDRPAALDRWERARRYGFADPEVFAHCSKMVEIARQSLSSLDAAVGPEAKEVDFLNPLIELIDRKSSLAEASLHELGQAPEINALCEHYRYAGVSLV